MPCQNHIGVACEGQLLRTPGTGPAVWALCLGDQAWQRPQGRWGNSAQPRCRCASTKQLICHVRPYFEAWQSPSHRSSRWLRCNLAHSREGSCCIVKPAALHALGGRDGSLPQLSYKTARAAAAAHSADVTGEAGRGHLPHLSSMTDRASLRSSRAGRQ